MHANTRAHGYSFTEKQIFNELGAPIADIFDKFDPIPIASGSIAQVYKAILNGVEVRFYLNLPVFLLVRTEIIFL